MAARACAGRVDAVRRMLCVQAGLRLGGSRLGLGAACATGALWSVRAQAAAGAPPRSQPALPATPAVPAEPAVDAEHRSFTSSDGVQLHFLEAGQPQPGRPSLVFVPGWSMPAWIWQPQLQHFARTHHVLALDPRGQGRSQVAEGGYTHVRRAADIAELLQHAGLRQVVLVGWSLAVLESLQALAPGSSPGIRQQVLGLVLVDNSVGEGTPPAPPAPGRPSFASRLRRQREATVDGFVRSMFKQPQPEPWLRALTAQALRLPLQASIDLLGQPTPREFWRDTLASLPQPVLYMVTPRFAQQGALAQARRPGLRTEVFEDAGHALFVDQPARFNTLLEAFVASAAASAPPAR